MLSALRLVLLYSGAALSEQAFDVYLLSTWEVFKLLLAVSFAVTNAVSGCVV
jgi:hypothetical protein